MSQRRWDQGEVSGGRRTEPNGVPFSLRAGLSSQLSQAFLWSWPASKEHRACQSLYCFTIPVYPAALVMPWAVEAGATQPRTMVDRCWGALAGKPMSDDKIYMVWLSRFHFIRSDRVRVHTSRFTFFSRGCGADSRHLFLQLAAA